MTVMQWRCGCGRAITTPVTGTSSSSPPFVLAEIAEPFMPAEFEFPAASCLSTQMSAAGEVGAGALFDGAAAASADFATMDLGGGACG